MSLVPPHVTQLFERLVDAVESIAKVVVRIDDNGEVLDRVSKRESDILRIYDDWYNSRNIAGERPPEVVLDEIGAVLYGKAKPK